MTVEKENKSTAKRILDIFDVGVTSVSFIVIFVTFMISILSRYIFKRPVPWTYELSILGYMWTMFFGVGKAIENDEHVVFSLIYDKLSPGRKRACLILYNIVMTVLLLICFIPCVQAAMKSTMKTGVLKLPYRMVFSPFFFMMVEVIIRSIMNVVRWIKADPSELEARKEEEAA